MIYTHSRSFPKRQRAPTRKTSRQQSRALTNNAIIDGSNDIAPLAPLAAHTSTNQAQAAAPPTAAATQVTSFESSNSAKATVPSARQVGGRRHPARRELAGVSSASRAKYGNNATKKTKVPMVEAVFARLKNAAHHEKNERTGDKEYERLERHGVKASFRVLRYRFAVSRFWLQFTQIQTNSISHMAD